MRANPTLLQRKYTRVIKCFALQQQIPLSEALDLFYRSDLYWLMREGVSDLHCMSEEYLAEELRQEYAKAAKTKKPQSTD